MKSPACARSQQAEALEDGRLSGSERASFEQHAASCAMCTTQLQALARLRQSAEWLPDNAPTPLERRRQRQALLKRASELSQRAQGLPRRPVFGATTFVAKTFAALALAGALLAAVGIGFGLRAALSGSEASVTLVAPTYRISTSPGASWHTVEQGAALRLRLGSGTFLLEVDKLTAVQRFVLELPDGELEVVGTRFGVRVGPQATHRVEVTEGRVALRLRGALPVSLGAGESWASEPEAAPVTAPLSVPAAEPSTTANPLSTPAMEVPSTPTATPPAAAPSEASVVKSAAKSPAKERAMMPPETQPVLEPSVVERAVTAGAHVDDFARAMAAFRAGDYGQAERLFQQFERHHPEDARQEDSTFLRAVARARRGDAEGARAAARQYLNRYPNGLRAPEAERLAGPRGAAEIPKPER